MALLLIADRVDACTLPPSIYTLKDLLTKERIIIV